MAVQYAKAAGFETIAVSHSPDKDRLIRELGADAVVRDGEGLSNAGGADVVLGTSNSADATADAVNGLRPDGRLVVMGFVRIPLKSATNSNRSRPGIPLKPAGVASSAA